MNQLTSWSFSSLTDWEKCPRMVFYKRIEKAPEPAPDPNSPLVRGNRMHQEIEDYITGKRDDFSEVSYDPELLGKLREWYSFTPNQMVVEDEWGLDENWNPVPWMEATCRMKLDCGVLSSRSFRVIDWKSGRKDGNEIKHTMQGQLYAIGASCMYPARTTVVVEFHYVDGTGTPLKATYTPDKIARFRATYDKRAARMLADTEFRAVPNKSNCKWCPFAINNHCPVAVK
jgi:CRISPR/Cas system-associated exonuclease Cas4 (RecB family)